MLAIIAGCGRVGSQLAMLLSYEGHNVVVIDRDPEAFHRLESPFNGLTLSGMAFDEDLLREAGVEEADAFVALTNYDNTNLMAAEIAASLFGIPRVIARVYNPDKESTYRKMGIDYICGSSMLAEYFHQEAVAGGIRHHFTRGNGIEVMEVDLGEAIEGRRVRDLRSPGVARLMAFMRDGKPMFFSSDTRLRKEDTLLMAVDSGQGDYRAFLADYSKRQVMPRGRIQGTIEDEKGWGVRREIRAIVAGCGRVGAQLAEMLSSEGHRVLVIDRDPASFQRLSKSFQGEVFEGMAFDMETLEEAGIGETDVFLALTNYDNTNLMAAEVARSIFGVDKVISRLYNPDKGSTYQALGIDYICGTSLMAEELLQRIGSPRLTVKTWTANNAVAVAEFSCPPRFDGRKVERLEREELLRVGLITRGMKTSVATRDTFVHKGDLVTAAVLAPRLLRVRRMVS